LDTLSQHESYTRKGTFTRRANLNVDNLENLKCWTNY